MLNSHLLSYAKVSQYQEIEKLYEQAYFKIKKAGLLRAIDQAYYPKSLVRMHADQTGLTKYIQQQEKKQAESCLINI